MIPTSNGLIEKIIEESTDMPSLTFKIFGGKIHGMIDEQDALAQAIDLILQTERVDFAIFSSEYGVELQDLFSDNEELFDARLQMRIEEALLADSRITGISDFSITREKSNVLVNMTVTTVFGEVSYERKI